MRREAMAALLRWKDDARRKPLMLRGARQVGKTWLVREFAHENFDHLLEINFERSPERASLFHSNDPRTICPLLTARTGIPLIPGRSLLFLDEVQETPEVLTCLRYFKEEMPELHVVVAGSLLELALERVRIPMPVGRVQFLFLEPLSFQEFLEARGRGALAAWLASWRVGDEMPDDLHADALGLIGEYAVVGGLPESVNAFCAGDCDWAASAAAVRSVLETYALDFGKYVGGGVSIDALRRIYASVPRQAGHKFKYSEADRDLRSRELSIALDRLCKARVATKIRQCAGNGLPMGAEADDRAFKTAFLDVGMLCAACGLDMARLSDAGNLLLVNSGAVAEQLAGQMLLVAEPADAPRDLFYWARESPRSNAEVDFLSAVGGRVVPIEIKAGATDSLRSMHRFLSEKHQDFGIRFNSDKPSWLETHFTDIDGSQKPFRLLSLPLYLAPQWRRLAESVIDS